MPDESASGPSPAPARAPGDTGRGVSIELLLQKATPKKLVLQAVLARKHVNLLPDVPAQQLQQTPRPRTHVATTPPRADLTSRCFQACAC
mmetsp:Transcript_5608/g.16539  ORF Transcript_5608/g.16539 Transcript_5608/m.16539 type:complete len:90 (-) Transcript_5608:1697-1966(-)